MKKSHERFNVNFILFLLGRMISDTGTSIQMMIIPLYIIDAGGTASFIGLFSFASLMPALLMYPFAGVIGDRLNRKKIMVLTDFSSAGLVLSLAFLSHLNLMNLTLLLAAQVVISLLNGLFDPATRGMVPQLVPENELTKANANIATARGLAVFLGPVIGALLYALSGVTLLFLVNGVSFLLSGISELFIRYRHITRQTKIGFAGVRTDLAEGMRFLMGNHTIRNLSLYLLLVYTLIQPVFAVALPLFFKTQLAYSDAQYGYLQSISILGMLAGSVLTGLLFGKETSVKKPLLAGSGMLMFSMLAFSTLMFPDVLYRLGNASLIYFVLLSLVLCLFAAAVMFVNVPVQSYIQAKTPESYISRVFSMVGLITRGGIPFGALFYGFVLERAAVHWTVLAVTLLMIMIGFAGNALIRIGIWTS